MVLIQIIERIGEMKARAIYTACEQVGPDSFKQVYMTREVELPDDFLTPDGMHGIHFIGLSFENEKIKGATDGQ